MNILTSLNPEAHLRLIGDVHGIRPAKTPGTIPFVVQRPQIPQPAAVRPCLPKCRHFAVMKMGSDLDSVIVPGGSFVSGGPWSELGTNE